MCGKQQAEKLFTSYQDISAVSMTSISTALSQSFSVQVLTSKSISESSSLEIQIQLQ